MAILYDISLPCILSMSCLRSAGILKCCGHSSSSTDDQSKWDSGPNRLDECDLTCDLTSPPPPQTEDRQRAAAAWARVLQAADTLSLQPAETEALWSVLAAIVHLGVAGVCKGETAKDGSCLGGGGWRALVWWAVSCSCVAEYAKL